MPISFTPLPFAPDDAPATITGGVVIGGYMLATAMADGSAGDTEAMVGGGVFIRGVAEAVIEYADAPPLTPTNITGGVFIGGEAKLGGSTPADIGGHVSISGGAFAVGDGVTGTPMFATGSVVVYGGAASESDVPTATVFMVEPQPIVVCYVGQAFGAASDQLYLGTRPERIYTSVTSTPLKLGTARRAAFDGAKVAREEFRFGSAASFVIRMLVEDGISFGTLATGEFKMLARAVSRLILGGHARSYAEALQLVADALVFNDLIEWMQLAGAAETLVLNDRIDTLYAAFAQVVERLVLSAQATPEFTLTVLLRDTFALGGQATHEAELAAQVADALGFAMSLSFDNGEFIAWVMNTESRGLTRYTNYPFNSFAKIGGKYYGAHAGGIARLGGRDDMGEPIKAKLRLGMFDFGDRHLKSFSDVFVGMAAGGQMLLKAIFVDEQTGEKNMAIYKVLPRPAAASRETRAKLGRGMKAVDWDFVLENVDGADFDLQSIQFYPTQLSRRTRG